MARLVLSALAGALTELLLVTSSILDEEQEEWEPVCTPRTFESQRITCDGHVSDAQLEQFGSHEVARALQINCVSGTAAYASKMREMSSSSESFAWAMSRLFSDDDPYNELAACNSSADAGYVVCRADIARRLWMSRLPTELVLPAVSACQALQDVVRLLVPSRQTARPDARRPAIARVARKKLVGRLELGDPMTQNAQPGFFAELPVVQAALTNALARHVAYAADLLNESTVARFAQPLRVLAQGVAVRLDRMLSEVFAIQQAYGVGLCLVEDVHSSATEPRIILNQHVHWEPSNEFGLFFGECKRRGALPTVDYQYHDLLGPRWKVVSELVKSVSALGSSLRVNLVEVGVMSGSNAEQILRRHPSVLYTGVDPFDADFDPVIQRWISQPCAQEKMRQFPERARLEPLTSLEAAKRVPNASLDIVFIDAMHTFHAVLADIEAWAPKVRPGGFVAGHDFCAIHAGVVAAVITVASRIGATIHIAPDCVWWFDVPLGIRRP